MWIAENWKDYEVIDCSKGEKLERWGKYLLVRPDPQVIWDTPKTEKGWRKMNGHYHRSAKGGGEWEFFDLPEQWQIHWIVDDCVKFVEREIRRGNHYDAIIMDPPSYGRGPKGEIWKIEDAIYPLVQLCGQLLSDEPLFFLINSYTTGLQPAVLSYMMNTVLKKYHGTINADEIGLPVSSNGLVLPCGASGRFER